MTRIRRLLIAALLSAVVSANFFAFMQARAMTRFIEAGERTGRPEQLGLLERVAVMLSGVSIPRPQIAATPANVNLLFSTHGIVNLSGESLEAWYVAGGQDTPIVVMFHGYAVSKSTLLSTAQALHEIGLSTLLVDFYGSGGSSGSGTTIGVKEADDVTAIFAYAKKNWPQHKIILYGISMGGAAVLRALAVNGVKPDGVVIEATFDSLLNTGKNRFRAMALPPSPFSELLLFWGSVQQGFNFFAHNPAEYAAKVECPALVLHGEKDARVTLADARRISAALGKHGRFVAFSSVPHMAIVDARRDDWIKAVAGFLQELR